MSDSASAKEALVFVPALLAMRALEVWGLCGAPHRIHPGGHGVCLQGGAQRDGEYAGLRGRVAGALNAGVATCELDF